MRCSSISRRQETSLALLAPIDDKSVDLDGANMWRCGYNAAGRKVSFTRG